MTKKKLFKASIIVNGKNHVLGTCKTQEEAAHLYDRYSPFVNISIVLSFRFLGEV